MTTPENTTTRIDGKPASPETEGAAEAPTPEGTPSAQPAPETAETRAEAGLGRSAGRVGKSADGGVDGATGSIGKLSERFGYSNRKIRDAIHDVKYAEPKHGNPDVVVDESGEVYPVGRDGLAGDSLGNIFDYLEDQ